ncbi:hypothetical protein BD779DRAFT_1788575 [Infundibulicybe gibba]|nr:hypothetical protein BD779DRAFT_1788575 [Infundibulicybe gibba]
MYYYHDPMDVGAFQMPGGSYRSGLLVSSSGAGINGIDPPTRIVQRSDPAYPPPKGSSTDDSHALYAQNNMRCAPFTDPVRAGWVAIAQVPFVFAFAAKNSVPGAFLGVGYEKLNFLHRFIGRIVVLAVNVHAIGYIYRWSLAGTVITAFKRPTTAWALVALLCLDCLLVFSTAYWRQKSYNLFISTHIICFILLLPAIYLHKKSMLPYILAAVGMYAFDWLLRVIKTRFATAVIRPLPQLGVTRVELPEINAGWRAGQHVRVRIISSGIGWWGWTEIHPFTIASVSGGEEGMVLLCKKSGSWTTKLYEMAKTGGYVEAGVGRNISMIIEGPYGGPGHTIFASYSAAVFVVGGSGVTFALSVVEDLIRKDLKGESRVKHIDVIWTVQDPASLAPLAPQFTALIQRSIFTPLKISVYYTRAPIGKFPFDSEFFHPGLTLAPGRPRVGKVLDAAISRAVVLGSGAKDESRITGLLVGTCGPVELADDVAKAVDEVEPIRRDQVGGVELHEEVFGW